MSRQDDRKGGAFLPRIIEAGNEADAVKILTDIAEMLHISEDFNTLRVYKDSLEEFSVRFKDIRGNLMSLSTPYPMEDIQDIRLELSFLLSELCDSGLVFNINRVKVKYAGAERSVKGQSFQSIKSDTEAMKSLGSKSVEAVKLAAGDSEIYKSWNLLNSYSYGLFCDLRSLQSSIEMVSHSVASAINNELTIKRLDGK